MHTVDTGLLNCVEFQPPSIPRLTSGSCCHLYRIYERAAVLCLPFAAAPCLSPAHSQSLQDHVGGDGDQQDVLLDRLKVGLFRSAETRGQLSARQALMQI